jgi:hypothetical protein
VTADQVDIAMRILGEAIEAAIADPPTGLVASVDSE